MQGQRKISGKSSGGGTDWTQTGNGKKETMRLDAPLFHWNGVQMSFSFMLTDKESDMRMCKHCKKAFVVSQKGNGFCSQKCKNQFNVYKSMEKKKTKK